MSGAIGRRGCHGVVAVAMQPDDAVVCPLQLPYTFLHRADIVTYLGQKLSANSKIDKDDKAYVTGAMATQKIQVSILS